MNREDIIRMGAESKISLYSLGKEKEKFINYLEFFAKLVAEHERNECLKFCDEVAEYFPSSGFVGSFIGSKIKARG